MNTKSAKSWQRLHHDNESRPDWQIASALVQLNQGLIWDDIHEEWKRQDDVIVELAVKYKKSPKWMGQQVEQLMKYGQGQCKINPWDAFIHVQSLEFNEGESLRLL
jgi:hypothetical protein